MQMQKNMTKVNQMIQLNFFLSVILILDFI